MEIIILYIVGFIIVFSSSLCTFFEIKKFNRKTLYISILLSLGSWFTIAIMFFLFVQTNIIYFIWWLIHLEFCNKKY